MKKMKLFPKTFLVTLCMLCAINLSMHLTIYFFYPKVYLNRLQNNLEKRLEVLQEEIEQGSIADYGQTFTDFAVSNHVNVTVEEEGRQTVYRGLNFEISLASDMDAVFSINNVENTESIIVKNRQMTTQEGDLLKLSIVASAEPVKEGVDMITFLLPYTFAATIVCSIVFSCFYSKHITRPILNMLKVTKDMKNLKADAVFTIQSEDEIGMLTGQINEVYESLLLAIRRLDEEKEHMLEVEKTKNVFLRSASHELKTPLAGLRILLENMQYGIGKYKEHEKYLPEAVAMVDELSAMVKEILDISKIQEVESEKQKIPVKTGILDVLQEYELLILEKELDVSISIPDELCICMQPMSFTRVWSNLIGNAVRYTKRKGEIFIQADEKKICIENTCEPLEEEQLKYIFEPFYRPDNTRNMQGGNGLGLYVVRELLKKEEISYSFAPSKKGMCFTIHRI